MEMDHAEIARARTVDRYLLGRLSPEEAERFERHYLACPECLAELATTEALVGGLRDVAAQEAVSASVRLGIAARLAQMAPWARGLALGALAGLFLLPAAWLALRLSSVSSELRTAGAELAEVREELAAARMPQAVAALLPLNPLRDGEIAPAEPVRQIYLGDGDGWVVPRAGARPAPSTKPIAPCCSTTPKPSCGAPTTSLPTYGTTLTLTVHGSSLPAGDYRIDLAGLSKTAEPVPAASFAFRVVTE